MPRLLDALFGFRKVRGHTFYSKRLNRTSTVVDLGANQGAFSNYVASKYQCAAFAVEASPALFARIESTALVHKYNYAVASHDGAVAFYESSSIEAGNIIGPKSNSTGNRIEVPARSFRSLILELGLQEIDLLKIDIEGAEIQMFDTLQDQDLLAVKQLTVEFHDAVRIPNVSTREVKRTRDRIVALGFEGVAMGRNNCDWLFYNDKKLCLPPSAKRYLGFRKQLVRNSED